jgi:hypothetical protein
MSVTMSVGWLVVATVVPLLAGLFVAWPFWRRRVKDEMGSIAGTFVVFTCLVGFVGREYLEIEQISASCVAREIGCRFSPSLFNRYGIYSLIAMAQVFVLFVVGLNVEERLRERERLNTGAMGNPQCPMQ